MVEKYNIRTDLALEEKERFESDQVEVQGVVLEEEYDKEREIRVTTVRIETENGAKTMGKPVGTYLTIEAPNLSSPDEGIHREVSEELAKYLIEVMEKIIPESEHDKEVLVIGLGNRQATPDALGPYVADNLNVTRHIVKEYGKYAAPEEMNCVVSAIVPGVMAQTGMETAEIIKGVVRETKPDLLIVIDALAARNSRRLNRTIQIADTGIHPGSGVGNHRRGMTRENLGVPVIAIGVPTVVGAAAIVHGTVNALVRTLTASKEGSRYGEYIRELDSDSQYELIRELLEPEFGAMFVTPQDMDERICKLSAAIAEGIRRAVERLEEER